MNAASLEDGWMEVKEAEIHTILSTYGTRLLETAEVNPKEKILRGHFRLLEHRRQEDAVVSTYEYDKCLNQGTYMLLGSLLKHGDREALRCLGDVYDNNPGNGKRFHRRRMYIDYDRGHPAGQNFDIQFTLKSLRRINGTAIALVDFRGPVNGDMAYGIRVS